MPHRLLSVLLASLLLAANARGMIDTDGDGVNDLWAARHGGALPPAADPDGDGLPNAHEAVAGTDPRDPQSRLAVRALSLPSATEAELRWPSVPGKLYRAQASADLTTWIDLPATREGDGGELTLRLPLDRTYETGNFTVSRWENLASNVWLDALKTYVANGTPAATRTLSLPALEVPQTAPDLEHFGQHTRGWIVPPADGTYRFFVASDDACELWLSPTADAAGRQRIARVPGWTSFREWTKYPEQSSASITLQGGRPYYFEFFHIEGAYGDHFSVAWTGPTLDPDKEILSARHLAVDPRSLAERMAASGRVFYRITAEDTDRDEDGLSDHDEAFLGTDPIDPTTQPRVPDRDAALGRLAARNRLTLGSSSPRSYELGSLPARITVFRSGNLNPVIARYTVAGTALPGTDFASLAGTVAIPAGADRAEITVAPLSDLLLETTENVTVSLVPDAAYELGSPGQTTVTLDDAPDELFLAPLRPPTGLASGAWGYAAVRAMGNGLAGRVSLSVSALRAPQADATFFISTTGATGPAVLTLGPGQIAARPWAFEPAAGQSHDAILDALREGRLWVRVASTTAPDGELVGQLLPATGAETIPAPPAAPALPGGTPTLAEASRFLNQATFGASQATVAALRAQGYAAWLDAQRALPATLLLPQVQARRAELFARTGNRDESWQGPLQESWWQSALTAPDQLRQRVAWALSQILVVSQEGALAGDHEPVAGYYDLLLTHALGDYRALLGEVTRSAPMGVYLSMMRNQKPNPETGQRPDENYAREVMQLFTIGLNQLHPDGTLRLDAEGLPRPTYTQADIAGLARVFTGWGPHYDDAHPPEWSPGNIASRNDWFLYGWDMTRPMTFYPDFFDPGTKPLLDGVSVPAGLPGIAALDTALDALFHHQNVGPFLGRQLIQKLVTSNPSPAYVFRVAAAFADNGSGVRGDLFATVRAVLLDPEARVPAPSDAIAYGKRAEPLLRLARLFRAFPPTPPRAGDPRLFLNYQYDVAHQIPLGSPSVFNFYQPVYAHPGAIATAGLVSPEFQITSETTVIGEANRLYELLFWSRWTGEPVNPADPVSDSLTLSIPLDDELAILARTPTTPAQNYAALVDHLADKLLGGSVSAALRTELLEFHTALPSWYWQTSGDTLLDRRRIVIRSSLHLLLAAPETVIDQ
jgi:uncharacterized protein (DUF1800 family)